MKIFTGGRDQSLWDTNKKYIVLSRNTFNSTEYQYVVDYAFSLFYYKQNDHWAPTTNFGDSNKVFTDFVIEISEKDYL